MSVPDCPPVEVANGGAEEPLDVIHFLLDPRVGGPHVYVATVAAAMDRHVRSQLATPGRGPMTDLPLLNLRRIARFLYPLEVAINALLISIRWGVLRRPSLFHVHGAANLAPLIAAWWCRMPVVLHFHETVSSHRRLADLGKWFVRRTPHAVMTVCRAGALAYAVPEAELVPGAVDTRFWSPAAESAVREPEGGPLRVVTVANLNPLKGQDVLLAALERIERPIELRLVGLALRTQAAYAARIDELIAGLKSRRPSCRIELLGGMSPLEVRRELARADVFVLPSRSEACPIALLEAMAMCRPCVATDVGAVREVVPEIQRPWICRPDDPADLARALDDLADRPPEERLRIGAANRAQVEAHHTPGLLARKLLAGYRRIVPAAGKAYGRR